MIVKTLLAAIVAGLIAGVFMTAAQELRVVPLIVQAEAYEEQEKTAPGAPAAHEHSALEPAGLFAALAATLQPVTVAFAHEGEAHDEGGILFGMSHFSGTLIANLVTGAGFGLLLAGISLIVGRPLTLRTGLTWGALGWLAVHLLPALGLPPELPGFPAADLSGRQAWWLATTVISAGGLALIALRHEPLARIAGLIAITLPHLYGAPQPADIASVVPAILAAEFAVAALATTLAFWLALGLASGAINDRFLQDA